MATDVRPTPPVSPPTAPRTTVAAVTRPATTSVESRAHLAAAAYLMKRSGDSALVVTTDDEERRPLAIVTDADIAQAVADGRDLEATRIGELSTAPPVTVPPDMSVDDAIRTMLLHRIHHLPVVAGERLVGIIDMADACGALFGRAEDAPG